MGWGGGRDDGMMARGWHETRGDGGSMAPAKLIIGSKAWKGDERGGTSLSLHHSKQRAPSQRAHATRLR